MVAPLFLALIDPISKLLDKIIPDPQARAQAKLDLVKEENSFMLQEIQAAVQEDLAQTNINTEEAKNESVFVSGWRPFIGWVCGTAFAYKFVFQPFLVFLIVACHGTIDVKLLPVLDWSEMMPVMVGLLGLGGLRTIEKIKA